MANEDETPDPEARFAQNLRSMREANGWNQSELARRLVDAGLSGFHQTTVSRLEKQDRPVRLGEATVIAQVFGVPVETMSGDVAALAQLAGIRSALAQAQRAKVELREAGEAYELAIRDLRRALGDPQPEEEELPTHSPWEVVVYNTSRDPWGRQQFAVIGYPGESASDSVHWKARRLLGAAEVRAAHNLADTSAGSVLDSGTTFEEPPF